jgi:hypothetical protein
MRLDPEPYLNLVGVDAVVHEAVALAQAGPTGVFHLTHPAPPTIVATVRTIFDMLELHEPVFTMDRESRRCPAGPVAGVRRKCPMRAFGD